MVMNKFTFQYPLAWALVAWKSPFILSSLAFESKHSLLWRNTRQILLEGRRALRMGASKASVPMSSAVE